MTPDNDCLATPTGSASSSEDAEPVLFFDYNFGRKVPDAMRAAGMRCEWHRDHFAQNTSDEEWLTQVGARGWFVITKDYRIGHRVNEIEALRNAKVGAFVLASDGLTANEMIEALTKALPKIRSFIEDHQRPFIAKFYRDGKLISWK